MRICNCADVYTGNSISESVKNSKYIGLKEGYNYIGTKDVNFDNTINYENGVKIPFTDTKFRNAYKNNTLICVEGGSAGRKVAKLSEDICFGNKLATINSWIVNTDYIYLVFQSSIIQNFFKNNMTGIIGGVSINKLKTFLIPIPPLAEQIRIVKKYKSFIPLINNYDKEYCKIETLNNNYKEELKKSILQYALQGKLVKQDPSNEPAEVLINKILDEKRELIKTKQIKKENLSVIYKDPTDNQFYEKFDDGKVVNISDEIPFEIPNNWKWARLKSISTKIVDGDHNPPPGQSTKTDFIMLSAKNIQNDKLENFDQARFLTKENYDKGKQRIQLQKDDILLTIVGTLGRSCIYKNINKNILFQRSVSVITSLINNRFIKLVLDSPYIQNKMASESTGTAQRGFYLNQVEKILIPTPPEREQFSILSKVIKMFNTIQ